ncbi:MAG: hypothetical protein ABIT76_08575 [Chthoniobacterales bacterium]
MTWNEARILAEAGQLVRRRSWPATTPDFAWLFEDRGLFYSDQFILTNGKLTSKGVRAIVTNARFTSAEFLATDWQSQNEYLTTITPVPPLPPTPPLPPVPPVLPQPPTPSVQAAIDIRSERFSSVTWAVGIFQLYRGSARVFTLTADRDYITFHNTLILQTGDVLRLVNTTGSRGFAYTWTTRINGGPVATYSGSGATTPDPFIPGAFTLGSITI